MFDWNRRFLVSNRCFVLSTRLVHQELPTQVTQLTDIDTDVRKLTVQHCPGSSLRTADAFPEKGREATTGNASSVRRLSRKLLSPPQRLPLAPAGWVSSSKK